MAQATPATLRGARDRAILLLGFAGALRRSELVALDVSDLEETEEGFRVTIRKSKTDQEGQGQTIAIIRGSAACPVGMRKEFDLDMATRDHTGRGCSPDRTGLGRQFPYIRERNREFCKIRGVAAALCAEIVEVPDGW
jgi:hypothetical protein